MSSWLLQPICRMRRRKTDKVPIQCRNQPSEHYNSNKTNTHLWVLITFYGGSFLLIPPSHWFNCPHTIMDMRNNRRRNVSTHARVNFSQSETSSLLSVCVCVCVGGGGGGGVKFWASTVGKIYRKDPLRLLISLTHSSVEFWKVALTIAKVESNHWGVFLISF